MINQLNIKLFLRELYRQQLDYLNKIEACQAELKKHQTGCKYCSATSADVTKMQLQTYQEAETAIDALINFYFKSHGLTP